MNEFARDMNLPKIGRDMLQALSSGKITVAEFDREIAYWMLKTVSDMHFQDSPDAPEDMLDYLQRKKRDNKYQVNDSFWTQDHIGKYVATDSHIRCANSGSVHWLKFMRINIPSKDIPAQSKIAAALYSHGESTRIEQPEEVNE